ncbi:MAG TPA: SH2 domain-containing protein [Chlamydiales bacterium]|nr:SH2 domain-containing protein [Chlamydiales bacterium]
MAQEISRREVMNNLIRFKDHLLEKRDEEVREGSRVYRVLLNCRTGDLRFTQKISALERHIARKGMKREAPEDWKEIQIIVQQKTAHFEMRDASNRSLKPTEIEPLAWKIASETLDVLNNLAETVKGTHVGLLPEEAALLDLSSIHLATPRERIEDLSGWQGSISRMDAEQRLVGKPVGTYLLREGDEITVSISFHFAEENRLSIHPYLLTVVEQEGKIVDILLLQTSRGWTLYHDDPNLKDPVLYQYHASPQALLHTLHQVARQPLF